MDTDVLIVGQGLAGSTLAWRLAERGVSAQVVDRGGVDAHGRPSASHVAAGLITPITGKRLTLAEDFDELWESARRFYRGVEEITQTQFLTEQPALRLISDSAEKKLLEQRINRPAFAHHASLANRDQIPECIIAEHGAFLLHTAARLNVTKYLSATRRWLEDRACFRREEFDEQECLRKDSRCIVFCHGFSPHPPHPALLVEFLAAKGEVLTIEADVSLGDRVIHGGVWIAPDESGVAGHYRVGATHCWDQLRAIPTAAGREELLAKLAGLGVQPECVIDHQAAIRPATQQRRPTYGFSDEEPRIGWLNGLGSKGSLWAPYYADRLADLVVQKLGG